MTDLRRSCRTIHGHVSMMYFGLVVGDVCLIRISLIDVMQKDTFVIYHPSKAAQFGPRHEKTLSCKY